MMAGTLAKIALIAVIVAAILAAVWNFAPPSPPYRAVEGQPLLEQTGPNFHDAHLGLRFTAPEGWSVQARSTEAAGERMPERMLVKYKRLIKGEKEAWLRVFVADAAADALPADLARNRKPREPKWTMAGDIEDLTIGGRPAARVSFSGQYALDKSGPQPWSSEVVAVVCGQRVYFFEGTFAAADTDARTRIRAALDSIVFE